MDEIKRLEEAIKKSKSPYLKRDYGKKLKKLKREQKNDRKRVFESIS